MIALFVIFMGEKFFLNYLWLNQWFLAAAALGTGFALFLSRLVISFVLFFLFLTFTVMVASKILIVTRFLPDMSSEMLSAHYCPGLRFS